MFICLDGNEGLEKGDTVKWGEEMERRVRESMPSRR